MESPETYETAIATPALRSLEAARRTVGSEVRSVDRAASLLIAIGESNGDAGVSELSRRLGLHKSTASRLLATLETRGLVERTESGRYRLGRALVRLGGRAESSRDLRALATGPLEALARSVHEASSLHVLESDAASTIAYADPTGASRERYGRSSALHASASGKVLLAVQPEREVIRLARLRFTSYSPNTIVRVDYLLEELFRVRVRGFATAFGEQALNLNAVAVPVFDQRSAVVAALEIQGPTIRISPGRVLELVEHAREAAAVITDGIGGTPFPNL
jgi:DNA-binding IclR family transcriptional regulator